MTSYEPGGFGRNSHIPACIECRLRKAKCSKTHPTCVQCSRNNRECVYSSRVRRTPLTREHLTKVESRLQMFETALGKLFPSGEIEEITRSLLADEMPEDQKSLVQSFMDTNESTFKDALLEPDPMPLDKPLDDGLNDSQSFDEINAGYDMFGVESFLNKNNQFNDPLSSTELEEVFVDTFFSRYHTLYPYVHEAIFRLKFEKRLPSSSSWPVLANIILAFGSWLAPEHHNDLGSQYYKRAQHHFEQIPLSDSGNITTVQALLLLSDFAQKLGHPWESWHYVATAVQKAISLNLHIEPTDPGLTAVDQEIRRRVWWATYCAESCSAKIYGRPLALPEDGLITVRSVTNTHDQDPASPTSAFPTPTNDPTIYSGLIQQSSYHRMANDIYRRVLSTKNVTPQLVHTFEEMINDWHTNNSSLCTRLVRAGSVEQWHMSAWRRQSLCDQSLRLLIHRPLLLRWLQNKHIHNDSALPAEGHSAEAQCRATGLNIARNTIAQTSEYLKKRTGDRMTLAFTLYALFHALLVPVILLKGDPSSPRSISYIQDIERAKSAVENLSVEGDTLSQSFVTVLDRLFTVARQPHRQDTPQRSSRDDLPFPKIDGFQNPINNIFGNEELRLLENSVPKKSTGLDFSEWLRS